MDLSDSNKFGIGPAFVRHALELRYERPVTVMGDVYVCGECRTPIEICTCDQEGSQ